MDDLELLIDLHKTGERQGPGGDRETRLAAGLAGLETGRNLKIADIGCGTGAAALALGRQLDAHITAVDFLPRFLEVLNRKAREAGLGHKITTLAGSMETLPFAPNEFDAVWSEGAIYNMGFEAGVEAWRPFLKTGGVLAVSELTWTTDSRPAALQEHWSGEYGEVDTASAKIAVLEKNGFSPIGYFPLPERCWLDNYYWPLRARFEEFLDAHGRSDAATALVEAENAEIEIYERNKAYFGYGFYIARKTGD